MTKSPSKRGNFNRVGSCVLSRTSEPSSSREGFFFVLLLAWYHLFVGFRGRGETSHEAPSILGERLRPKSIHSRRRTRRAGQIEERRPENLCPYCIIPASLTRARNRNSAVGQRHQNQFFLETLHTYHAAMLPCMGERRQRVVKRGNVARARMADNSQEYEVKRLVPATSAIIISPRAGRQ